MSKKSYKIVVLGESEAGKTQLVNRLIHDEYDDNNQTTIGVEFATKILDVEGGERIKLMIWDTAGQERF